MQTLILDYSKWRCGGCYKDKLGEGDTCLLNNEGYMCCLGQFSLQLNNSLKEEDINNKQFPMSIYTHIPHLNMCTDGAWHNTSLSRRAMTINDGGSTTPEEKIEALKELFAESGFDIVVINKPSDQ